MNPQKLTLELIASGMTQTEIARELECAQTTVSSWVRGARHDITYVLGRRLEQLHQARCASFSALPPSSLS